MLEVVIGADGEDKEEDSGESDNEVVEANQGGRGLDLAARSC